MAVCIYGCGKEYVATGNGRLKPKGHRACYDGMRTKQSASLRALVTPANGFAEDAPQPAPKHDHPKGWEPRVEVDGDAGLLVSGVTENADPERDALLSGSDLDPRVWEIVGDLAFNKWQDSTPVEADSTDCRCSPTQSVRHHEARWKYQYKARLRRVCAKRSADVAELIEEIRSHVPKPIVPTSDDDGFVVCIADPQMGKGDGDGASGTVGRFLAAIDAVEQRVNELRAIGRPLGTLYILGLGDLIENCDGHYPQQGFRVELDLREQVNVMRRLILKAIERWAPLFGRVVVAAVGGNHGENRKDGKSFTTFADNHDLAIFDQLQDVFAMNPETYGHVTFQIPKDRLALTLDVAGVIVGITHGHIVKMSKASASKQMPEGSQIAKRVIDWWAQMAHGQQPIGDAQLLITGHYHHLLVTESGRKTHIQCPAMEGGSDWWRNLSGQESRPGMLTLRVGKDVSPSGWADPQVV